MAFYLPVVVITTHKKIFISWTVGEVRPGNLQKFNREK